MQPDGTVAHGAEAIYLMLSYVPRHGWKHWLYRNVPGLRTIVDGTYRFISRHRTAAYRVTKLFCGKTIEPIRYELTASIFTRLLAVAYLVAVVSLWTQIEGLVGSNGIMPFQPFADGWRAQHGSDAFWKYPTFSLFNTSDQFLHVQCGVATLAGLALLAGLAPTICMLVMWVMYLSLSMAAHSFLSFQWDTLLLEVLLLSALLYPPSLMMRTRRSPAPNKVAVWLLRFLLFKLMFASGIAKIAGGDKSWWPKLTALTYHYETTCLPLWTNWFVHHAPFWIHKYSCLAMFVIEICLPFLFFAPRRLRIFAFWGQLLLQVLIASTGNYAFFNLLTMVLCVPLLDDAVWSRKLRRNVHKPGGAMLMARRAWLWIVVIPSAVALFSVSFMIVHIQTARFMHRFDKKLEVNPPEWVRNVHRAMRPYRSINGYGLFVSMTKERPEIVIEGSNDGRTWVPYEFKWKVGDVSRRPRLVAPHQPRLDWQMWFAALGNYEGNQWFINLLQRLMEGSPEVLSLMGHNPFPEKPPRMIRALRFKYTFSDREALRERGEWWEREFVGLYCPIIERRENVPTTR